MSSRGSLALIPRTRKGLAFFWAALFILSLALQYAAAASPQRALALSGAIYSSNFDGSITNANHYPTKPDVYLTGGPCQGGSHLDEGDYYFEIAIPNTATLLSTDAIGNRKFQVGANGFITGTSGTHGTHVVACSGVTGVTLQLIPFKDTTNSGGEYKLTVATAASVEQCDGFAADAVMSICDGADQKSDNFKVLGPGSLKITKAIEGGPGDFSGSFPVDVSCADAGSFSGTIVFPEPGFITIPKIDAGAKCTITEGTLPAPPAGYTWGTPTYTGNPATIVSGESVTAGVVNHLNVIPRPAFTIVKGVSLSAAGPFKADLTTQTGTTVHYRITVTNTGNVVLTGVTLKDDKTLDLVAAGCTIPTTLAVGLSFHCDYSNSAATGTVVNTATADTAETAPASDSATVIATVTPPPPTLIIDKTNNAPLSTLSLPTAAEGATVKFTLSYAFTGQSVSSATITDVLPAGLTYVTGSATSNTEFTFVNYTAGTRTLTWTAAAVTKSGSVSYDAKVDVGAAALVQPLKNVASIVSEDTDKDTDDSVVYISAAPLAETSVPTAPLSDTLASGGRSEPGTSLTLILLTLAALALTIALVTPPLIRKRTGRR
jgi:fimbrial isopeptide formation D2 family protein